MQNGRLNPIPFDLKMKVDCPFPSVTNFPYVCPWSLSRVSDCPMFIPAPQMSQKILDSFLWSHWICEVRNSLWIVPFLLLYFVWSRLLQLLDSSEREAENWVKMRLLLGKTVKYFYEWMRTFLLPILLRKIWNELSNFISSCIQKLCENKIEENRTLCYEGRCVFFVIK